MTTLRPVLRYPGSKARIAPWIISHFPPHRTYLEPFAGSFIVLLAKPPSIVEICNDLDSRVCNLFRVLRDQPEELIGMVELTPWARDEHRESRVASPDPVEDARRLLVLCWQSVGAVRAHRSGWRIDARPGIPCSSVWRHLPERLRAAVGRLQSVQIENVPALELIARYADPDVLIYADPPYCGTVRRGAMYDCEMEDTDSHEALLAALNAHPGPVVLSGYQNALYGRLLRSWQHSVRAAQALTGEAREESLWLNPMAAAAIGGRLPGLEE